MDGRWQLVTAPTTEPLTTAEVKLHLRVDHSVEDTPIAMYAKAARQAVEEQCWIALMTQTWDYFLDAWPVNGEIELPRPPLQSVTAITYRDDDGTTHTLSASDYNVDTSGLLGRVVLKPSAAWPTVELDSGSPIKVRFVAGYASAALVPDMAKTAVLWLCGEMYQYREAIIGGSFTPSLGTQRVLNLLKVRYE